MKAKGATVFVEVLRVIYFRISALPLHGFGFNASCRSGSTEQQLCSMNCAAFTDPKLFWTWKMCWAGSHSSGSLLKAGDANLP